MIGRMSEPQIARNGTFTVTVSGIKEDLFPLWDALKDCDCDFEIKKHRKKRSLNANAYAWVLMGQIAQKMDGMGVEDYYRRMIKETGIKTDIICVPDKAVETVITGWEHNGAGWLAEKMDSKLKGCVNLRLIYGSSSFDSAEMARFIDFLIQDAEAMGIPTVTETEIKRMLGGWKNGQEPIAG